MTTKIRLVYCILAFVAPAWAAVRAAQPETAPTTGKVLVLDNERTLEGDIERVGEQYRVRRPVGELWVRAENTLRLCRTKEEAYTFLRSQANLRDPDEHLRLAHWCHQQGLRGQALQEATAAVELRPTHAESRRLLLSLQRAAVHSSPTQPVKPREEGESAPTSQPPELSTESLSLFLSRVQPILMNACANCHATGRGGAFKLIRTYEVGMIGRRTTQQNLAAVLEQIQKDRPSASPLLTKAVSIHGKPGEMTQSPLKNREEAAYRSLEEWVRITVENTAPRIAKMDRRVSTPTAERVGAGDTVTTAELSAPRPAQTSKTAFAEAKPSAKGEGDTPPEPVDPFDPVIFNGQMHPKQNK
jgi:hypothetical protein